MVAVSRTTALAASIVSAVGSPGGIIPTSSRIPVQHIRASRTSSSITYWASTVQRRLLRTSSASLTTATDSSTTIALDASPASNG